MKRIYRLGVVGLTLSLLLFFLLPNTSFAQEIKMEPVVPGDPLGVRLPLG